MAPEVLFPLLLALVGAALHLAREAIRRNAARRVEETRCRAMVDLAGHCGPDAVLVDHRFACTEAREKWDRITHPKAYPAQGHGPAPEPARCSTSGPERRLRPRTSCAGPEPWNVLRVVVGATGS